MPQIEILIRKTLRSVNTRGACPVAIQEVPTLEHEVFNHTVESAVLVTLRSAQVVLRLAGTVLTEVLCCAWDGVGEELHFYAAEWLAAEGDVEENDWIWLSCHVLM